MTSKTFAFIGILCASIPVVGLQAQTAVTHDPVGNRTSQAAVGTPVAPTIISQPSTTVGQVGAFATFSVIASGTGPLTYQWYENNTVISGATGSTLYITSAQSGNFTDHATGTNSYYVKVTNSVTTVISNTVALYLDTDSTGMADWWQTQYFGAIGVNPGADADGDGVTNLQEYIDGTNPIDASSRDWFLTATGPFLIQPNLTRYPPGTTVTLTAQSPIGAYFECWTGDLTGANPTQMIVMNSNKSVVEVTSSVITPATAPTLSASSGNQAPVNAILLEGNGQFYVGGRYQTLNGRPQWDLGRINSDGSLDTTYFAGAGVGLPNSSDGILAMAQQADGKLLVGGFAGALPGQFTPSPAIYRVNTDGSIDTSFVAAGATYIEDSAGAHADIHDIVVLSTGKILIAGDFTTINGVAIAGIARLNSDGSLDTTFNTGGGGLTGFNNFADVASNCLVVDSNGLIYVAGEFTAYNGVSETGVARLHADGTLDATFNPGSNFLPNSASATCVMLVPGIGVLLGGDFNTLSGDSLPGVMAFNTDGTPNTNFNLPSSPFISATCFALQANGQILVGGDGYGTITRLNTDGSIDTTFRPIFGGSGIVQNIVVQTDGKILVGGNFSSVNQVPRADLARLNSDGSLDTTAVMNAGVSDQNGFPNILVEEPDGKVLVAGGYTLLDNNNVPSLGRLNADGSFDPTFNPGGTGANSTITTVVPTGNKIFIGGYFNQYNGTTARGYAQLNLDGTLDSTFTPGPQDGSVSNVTAAVVQSDGKFIMAGEFQEGTANIERLGATGTVDTTYLGQTTGQIACEALQPDGKLLIGGFFTKVDGVSAPRLARLMPDGSLDTTFNPTTLRSANQAVSSMALLPSGQILVSVASGAVQRINSDGSTDSSYVNLISQYDLFPSVSTITALPDGSAIIGGTFVYTSVPPVFTLPDFPYTNSLNEVVQYCIKLTPTGAPDPAFNPALNAAPQAVLALSNGEIYAAGSFTTDAAENAVGLVRLSASPFLQLGPVNLAPAGSVGIGATETLSATATSTQGSIISVIFESSTDNVNFTPIAMGTSTGNSTWTATWTPATAGNYYLRSYATDSVLNIGESVAILATVSQSSTQPQITAPPQNVSITLGSPASFNVTATGGGLTYQWQYDSSPLSGQISPTLSLGSPTLAQAGNYNVVVSNNVGMVTSSTAILSVAASVATWDATYGVSGSAGTPLNDGVPNLLKYFFDINPSHLMTATDQASLPASKMIMNNGNSYLTLTFREYSAAIANGVTPTLQSSADLQNWSTVPSNQLLSQQVGTDSATGDPIMEMGAELNGSTKLFIRLQVNSP